MTAKGAADDASLANNQRLADLAAAQAAAAASAEVLKQRTAEVDQARQRLEAVLDAYLQPGAVLPTPSVPAGPAPPAIVGT
jgi:hypothetical protein